MNAIVLIALRRRLTFVVLAILILIFGGQAVFTTPTDIFPAIRIPVVAVVWSYSGMLPKDMSGRVVYYFERSMTTTVSNIEHIESQSLYGTGVIKIFFQPGTNVAAAQAQIAASAQTVLKQMPAGITPPQILVYDASSVPVLDLQVSGTTQTVQQLYDLSSNFIRPALITVPGVAIPTPYGGTSLVVEVDLNQQALLEHGLSAEDVSKALATQNLVLPAGDQKIGKFDFLVATNAAPVNVDTFNNMPIRQVGNAVVYLRDVAYVHRGGPPQTNMVLVHGRQSVLMQILKTGDASTLAVVGGIKNLLPQIEKTLPPGVKITLLNDASKFVRASVDDVVQEMVTAALLTGALVLLFLGSWRSTVIVAVSIPLCILTSIAVLSWLGQTINVMTLGGLALAVGILVDDATVMIENISSHLEEGEELEPAIINAANQIVIPTFVSTICICIVWLPLFSLSGIGGYLFKPLAMAIVFAMIASFILSRTLVPTMAVWMLQGQVIAKDEHGAHLEQTGGGIFTRFQRQFNRGFERFRNSYHGILQDVVYVPGRFILVFLGLSLASLLLIPFLGRNFFPEVRSGEMDMHMRAQVGTRIEDSGKLAVLVGEEIRKILPGKIDGIVDNCGLPVSGINEVYNASGTIGPADCDITISLKSDSAPVQEYRKMLRKRLPSAFPGTTFTFLPGDITAKILDFGLPAPIDIQITGRDQRANFEYAKQVLAKVAKIPGVADANIYQSLDAPSLRVTASRTFASSTGLTEANIANNTLGTLSGSGQVAPSYWLNTKNGVSYLVNIQTPQSQLTSMNDLETIPIDAGDGAVSNKAPQLLGALARITQTGVPMVVSHYDITPTIDVFANLQGRDLGAVADAVQQVIDETANDVPKGASIEIRGQGVTMVSAYEELLGGLAIAVILVYLVIVVNFQSWTDPFIIITALPGALAGIVWSLFLTQTTLSVPALTGAIMCMGTATANSILVVSFAREQLAIHGDAARAAAEAGFARIRPVMMTALAMMIGMLPMSLSNTQNAPLGRAVIGGLAVATISTLLFVPAVFTIIHGRLFHKTGNGAATQ